MNTLNAAQRRLLEKTVTDARQLAEKGAVKALQNLAADQPEPFAHMGPGQRELRRRLRAKARLLGDENTNGKQQIENLSYELAYEHWHKMLFSRFLEANNLLMHPTHGIAVSLDECAEFAAEEGYGDKWTAAAAYASHMLPAIFRPDDPLMQVEFATEDRIALERLLEGIGNDIYIATDSLGWVYQFWQSKAKAEINASGDKIDGKRLPAVTQLFTEPYMVNFLIDNTLGAWWVSCNPGVTPPVNFEYLRYLPESAPPPSGGGREGVPAAGKFENWPNKTALITTLDPCMGSGHFVVELFLKMAPLRMFEEGLSREEATCRVIAENLHGLEIDPRCTQIAAFNLALTAWKFCGHYLELPEMNLACSGLAPKGKVEDWVKLVHYEKNDVQRSRLENGMRALYEHFQLAPELGSLLDPTTIKPDVFTASFEELQPALLKALENEEDKDLVERGVMAAGIAKAGKLLAKKYTLQITNVPYLSRGKQDEVMAKFCAKHYPEAKGDLATVFFEKMLKTSTGTACSVIPQNWLFLTSYKQLREKLLKNRTWSIVARLGAKGFQTPMWDFNVMLIAIHSAKPTPESHFTGLDVSDKPNAAAKDEALKTAELKIVNQVEQLGNPDLRIVLDEIVSEISLLETIAESGGGVSSFDSPRFMQLFLEQEAITNNTFILCQSSPELKSTFTGRSNIFKWENGVGGLYELMQAKKEYENYSSGIWIVWSRFLKRKGICVGLMGNLAVSHYDGYSFDNNTGVVIPNNEKDLAALWTYCSSNQYKQDLRNLDQKLNITSGTLVKVPFDLQHWQKVAAEKYPNGLPKPYSDDPTQWLFHGHPQHADYPLQVALARVMGYRWPAETDEEMELDEKARLHIAQVKAFDYLTDDDGILCIPPVNGERPAAEALRDYIRAVWGEAFGHQTLQELLQKEGATATGLEQWLRNDFFAHHCKVFQNRPFIWHIWDGHKEGFSVLVNYHKLSRANLQKLIYTYLNDWIRHCERKQKDNESGADGLLMAARQLKIKLELILEGEPPYDIFVRWKPLHQQPIGWEPDLNDGVRLNIYPFMQAGILRKNPNIKWQKDRGKNPAGAPWGPDRFNRYEDLDDDYKLKDENGKVIERLGNEVKRGAREKAVN